MFKNTETKKLAFEQFVQRKKEAPEKINNASLVAGEPMFFYCNHCGVLTEKLHEEFLFPPFVECSQCYGLSNLGWLDEAKKFANGSGV